MRFPWRRGEEASLGNHFNFFNFLAVAALDSFPCLLNDGLEFNFVCLENEIFLSLGMRKGIFFLFCCCCFSKKAIILKLSKINMYTKGFSRKIVFEQPTTR